MRGYRTWPKFAGAAALAAGVIFADGYPALAAPVGYLLAAAAVFQGLAKRYLIATVGISSFAVVAAVLGYFGAEDGGRGVGVLLTTVKIITLAWVSAYLYITTSPAALVRLLSRAAAPFKLLGVRTEFWAASLGFAVGALAGVRGDIAGVVAAARLRGASRASLGRRIKLAELITAKALTEVVAGAVARADAAALRGGNLENILVIRERGPTGVFNLALPVLVLFITIAASLLW